MGNVPGCRDIIMDIRDKRIDSGKDRDRYRVPLRNCYKACDFVTFIIAVDSNGNVGPESTTWFLMTSSTWD